MCGAFSDKWLKYRSGAEKRLRRYKSNGVRHPRVRCGQATRHAQFDVLTLIHNETSTGVMSPLAEIAALKKKYPDVMFIVDSVSSNDCGAAQF